MSLDAALSAFRDVRVCMINVRVVSRLRERMNLDDRAFAQKLLRVILASPQLQNSIGISFISYLNFIEIRFWKVYTEIDVANL